MLSEAELRLAVGIVKHLLKQELITKEQADFASELLYKRFKKENSTGEGL